MIKHYDIIDKLIDEELLLINQNTPPVVALLSINWEQLESKLHEAKISIERSCLIKRVQNRMKPKNNGKD